MARRRYTLLEAQNAAGWVMQLNRGGHAPTDAEVQQLKGYVRSMWDAARKRLNRLDDPRVVGQNRVGGSYVANQFGPKGSSASNDPQVLRDEYFRLNQFLNSKTSTPAGYKQWYDKQEALWGIANMAPQQIQDFWDAYHRAVKQAQLTPQGYDSKQLVHSIGNRIITKGMFNVQGTADDIVKRAKGLMQLGIKPTESAIMEQFDVEEQ